MRRLLLLTVALFAVAACDRQDGYRFERRQFERAQPGITVVTHPSLADLRAKAPRGTEPDGQDLYGWSIIHAGGGCELHVVDPRKSWMPEWLGHEAAHCIWGRWHK